MDGLVIQAVLNIMNISTNYIITKEQHRALRMSAAERGISVSALIREILDKWVRSKDVDACLSANYRLGVTTKNGRTD